MKKSAEIISKLIRPNQSKNLYAAITATKYGVTHNFLLKSKNSVLQSAEVDLVDIDLSQAKEVRDTKDKDYFYAKLFPEEQWNEFLTFLNPKIINSLKPQSDHRRELIYSYNFCREAENENAVYNRSLGIGLFPLIRKVIDSDKFHVQPREDSFSFLVPKKKTYAQRLDENGLEALEILKENFSERNFGHAPWATSGFLKRMALVSSLEDVEALGRLLILGVENNPEAYNIRVSRLPSSMHNPEEFKNMWENFKYISQKFSGAAATNLFVNIEGKWAQNKAPSQMNLTQVSDIDEDYFKAIARDLLLPVYFQKVEKAYAARGEAMPEELTAAGNVDNVLREMKNVVAEKLTKSLTPKTLRGYANRRQSNHAVIDSQKALIKNMVVNSESEKPEWFAIIDDQELDGYSYKVLTSPAQLAVEAKEMQNCVVGFRLACKEGERHILSGYSPQGERFMLDIQNNNGFFTALQVRVFDNVNASAEITQATENLVQKMNEGKIAVSKNLGSIEETQNLVVRLGFNPLDQKEREDVVKVYQNLRILPHKFCKCDFGQFIAESGLEQEVVRVIESYHGENFLLKPSNSMVTTIWNRLFGEGKSQGMQ